MRPHSQNRLTSCYRRLPALLRQLRSEAGLTQRDMAARMGISHVAIHKCETGDRRVDVAEFVDWAKACRTDPHEALRRYLGGTKAKST